MLADNNVVHTFQPKEGKSDQNLCGSENYKDHKVELKFNFPHEKEELVLVFTENFFMHSTVQSWGISDLKITYNCTGNKVGNYCMSQKQLQHCSDVLGKLDGSSTNNKSIRSSSTVKKLPNYEM